MKSLNIQLIFAGIFMGLANLVPGVSGGTMVYALGQYDKFIKSMGEVTKLNFSKSNITFLCSLFGIAIISIILFSGVIQILMERFRPLMLFTFIGLTLGGIPAILKNIGKISLSETLPLIISFTLMIVITFFANGSSDINSIPFLVFAGIVGSSAMILPGISGSYLLLLMGCYIPIIESINLLKSSLTIGNTEAALSIFIGTILPFGCGIILGIISLSNILGVLLKKKRRATELFLLGLLAGSLIGLYPFATAPLSKIAKYATRISGELVLNTILANDTKLTFEKKLITEMNKFNIKTNIIHVDSVDKSVIDNAKKNSQVILSYNKNVDSKLKIEKIVPIQTIPDTSFTFIKLLLGILLFIGGFFTSYKLSTLKNNSGQ